MFNFYFTSLKRVVPVNSALNVHIQVYLFNCTRITSTEWNSLFKEKILKILFPDKNQVFGKNATCYGKSLVWVLCTSEPLSAFNFLIVYDKSSVYVNFSLILIWRKFPMFYKNFWRWIYFLHHHSINIHKCCIRLHISNKENNRYC